MFFLHFRPVFRSYKPQDDSLKESALPTVKPADGKSYFPYNTICLFFVDFLHVHEYTKVDIMNKL